MRKYELSGIVRELRKIKRFKHALEVCEWMKIQENIKLVSGDYAVHLDLIAKVQGLLSAEEFFVTLPNEMKTEPTYTALLHNYVRNKESVKAEALMEKMAERGFLKQALPYNHMLALYLSEGQLDKFPGMIQELKKHISPNVFTYNLWLTMCAAQNDVEAAEKVFLEIKKSEVLADWMTYSVLASLYIKLGLSDKAKAALKDMEKRMFRQNRAAYSSLLSLHTSMGDKDELKRIWNKMKLYFRKMSDSEYIRMISSHLKLGLFKEADDLLTEWVSVSGSRHARVPNVLLSGYVRKHDMEMAEELYKKMVQKGINPNYTTWELLTWGHLQQKQTEKAINCFKKAVGSVNKWIIDEKLVREMYKNLEEEGNIHGAEQVLAILRKAGQVNTDIYNVLLRTYEKAGKMPLIVAERMKEDNVELDEETHKLIRLTSKMCVSEVPSKFL